ncbi:DUF4283 domain-containing protein [Cephalotus follicularis]|uniref:DUF4283 domain-containing protein n=1 Tax=Cephalotus follicularis TaxID=3775 RepID=A0A1Q3D295_CEPFO|nr:DUF4283 domain-containing protein [Cephalotus follicularis]
MSRGEINLVPIWVKLHRLPIDLWTGEGIGCVAGSLGEPLYLDIATEATMRLAYARVCVEMPVFGTFPEAIKFCRPEGKIVEVVVEYTWKPNVCHACRSIEYSRANFPRGKEQVVRK